MKLGQTHNQLESYVHVGGNLVQTGHKLVKDPSFNLYSPRTVNRTLAPVSFPERSIVYYSVGYTTGNDPNTPSCAPANQYEDIYAFVFACRASKETDNYYLFRPSRSVNDIKESSIQPYNLVSGGVLPPNPTPDERHLIHKYMMMGLHCYYTYLSAGVDKTTMINSGHSARIISKGGHMFKNNHGAMVNLSTVFMGILIDYYRIESGIRGKDAQISFNTDPEYRYIVFQKLRTVFHSFVNKNTPSIEPIIEDSRDLDIIMNAVNILRAYLRK